MRLPARSSDRHCLLSDFCSSGRDFAPRFLTWGLRCQEQNLQASTSFFRSLLRCDEREARYILAALRSLRQTPPVVPPVADGPGVSLISACGDGEPEAIPHARYAEAGTGKISSAKMKRSQTLSCALPWDNSHRQWSSGAVQREHNTTRGGARFQWLGHRCHILTCGGPQQWIQTMMQIYASAARLRSSGAHS